ncbi:hypothetical protein N7530_008819 [Penicillium desertorum]|uniref:Uncharacterized protein n=1 Tax=Penicillium desertorum TaxID=1303715 RepID=A0A9W9WPT3_9EURO|nr:hypothetical protein N7530_008819 [Penicillium desertorum]
MFPKERFDENGLFAEITAPIAQVENRMVFMNDMLSLYKQFDEPRDQTSLARGSSLASRTPVFRTLRTFLQAYVTWHLCDPWYRLQELHSLTKESAVVSAKLHNYLQSAKEVGSVDPKAWAYPSVASLAAENATS